MYKTISIVLAILVFIAGGCDRWKTKEELVTAGMKQLRARNSGAAVIYFKNALEKDENYLEARLQLGRAYSALEKYDAAEKELRKVLQKRPGAREVQIELARACALGGKPDEALNVIAQMNHDGNDAEILEISGWAHALNEEYPTAVSQLKKALSVQAGRPASLLMLSRVYLLTGMPAAAQEQISELLKTEPSNRKALYLLAEIQVRKKDLAAAVKTYDRIIADMPDESRAYFKKGMLFIEMERYDEALELSEALIKNFSSRPEGYQLKGIGLFSKKNYKEAVNPLQKTVSLHASAETCYLLGLCHYYNQEFEQAMNQVQRALILNPNFIQARLIAALIYLKKNKIDDAVQEIRKVLDAQDRNALAHSILGAAYLSKGWDREGIAELDRALKLDPNLVDARIKKGFYELSQGRTDAAEVELKAAVTTNPDLLNTRLLLAAYYLKQNENAKAIATAQQGLRNQKTDALLLNIIADAHLQQHRAEEAMSALQKAKDADPGHDVTYFKIAALHQFGGQREKGLTVLKTFAEQAPKNVKAQLVVASLLEANGNDKEARIFYERAFKTGTTEGALETARYYLRNDAPDKAIDLLNESLRKNPAVPALHVLKGQAYLSLQKVEDAVQAYEDLAKIEPAQGLSAIINTFLAVNKPERALERVRRELIGKPERADLQAELSRIYIKMGKRSEAIENALQMVRRQPGSASGYITLAMVHENAKELDKAIEVLRKAPNINDLNLTMMLGRLYAAQKDYPAALSQCQEAEALKAGHVPAIFQKASTLHAMGKTREAIAEYQRVLKLSPDHVPVLNNLAYLLAEDRNSLAMAMQYAVRAYVLAPREGAVQDTLGFVLVKSGKVDEGLKALRQAASVLPDNPSIQYHLALALKEHKDTAAAAAALRKALALGDFPESVQAKTLLTQLNDGTGAGTQ